MLQTSQWTADFKKPPFLQKSLHAYITAGLQYVTKQSAMYKGMFISTLQECSVIKNYVKCFQMKNANYVIQLKV